MHELLKSATYDRYDDSGETSRQTNSTEVSSNITFLGTALYNNVGRRPFHSHTLQQCCPTFLCTRAQFADAYGGAGATTLLLLLLNTTISITS
jgi:hypothetical protein